MATRVGGYAQQLSLLNHLNRVNSSFNKHMTAIATGNKVNSAADDASIYAIGTKMGIRVGALDQAAANTQTGSAMLKVADGAMSNTLDILSTMREKALAAANSTAKDSDRASIQKEFNQYIDQINDNSLVEYNGMALMNGSHSGMSRLTTQAYTNKSFGVDTTGDTKLTDLTSRNGDSMNIQATDTITVSFVKDGKTYTNSYKAGDTTLSDIFASANQAGQNAGIGDVFDTTLGSTKEIGTDANGKTLNTSDGKNAITVKAAQAGKAGEISGFAISVQTADGQERKDVNGAFDNFTESIGAAEDRAGSSLKLQVGADANQTINVGLGNISAYGLGLQGSDGSNLSVATAEDAQAALAVIDNAINKVLDQSTNVGALSSRLGYTHDNLTTESENLTAAQTTLMGADIAKEITNMASDNMMMQATQAMLAQSYQNSSWFLNLLR